MRTPIWILSFFIIFISVQVSVVKIAFGTEQATTTAIPSETNLSPTIFATNEYQLPYPGVLPDSPLYLLKATRDKLVSFLISDPAKKAEFSLRESDKRLNAGLYLYQKKKYSLIVTTISKGENYFEEAVGKVEEGKRQGQDVQYIIDKMVLSLEKHKQVIDTLRDGMPKEYQSGLELLDKRAVSLQGKVSKLSPK